MVSVITWQTIYLNGIIHSFDLAKANMHVAEEKSVTHKTQNTRRAFLCVTDKRDNCSTYFLPDTRCIINMYNPQIEMFARFKMKSSFHKTKRII